MSLQFSDTSTYKGLIQIYEKEAGYNRGDVSGNTDRLKEVTADINLAWDSYLSLAINASGKWQFDDSNHTDYPIMTANLVQGQRDYSWTVDGNSNLVLDIYRVAILTSATATQYEEAMPVDVQGDVAGGLLANDTTQGVPYRYDKTANAVFFDPIPSYSATNGIKVWINREASYFAYTDTTKKPGCPGNHHEYFALKAAEKQARRKNLDSYPQLVREIEKMEKQIVKDFSLREKDTRKIMTPNLKPFI